MVEIERIDEEFERLREVISKLMVSTGYDKDEDLTNVTYDSSSPDDLQRIEKYREMLYKFTDVLGDLNYLKRPVRFEDKLTLRPDGRYGTLNGETYYTSGSLIEFLNHKNTEDGDSLPIWRTARVEHDGNGYYIVGFRNVPLDNLMVRVRGR